MSIFIAWLAGWLICGVIAARLEDDNDEKAVSAFLGAAWPIIIIPWVSVKIANWLDKKQSIDR